MFNSLGARVKKLKSGRPIVAVTVFATGKP